MSMRSEKIITLDIRRPEAHSERLTCAAILKTIKVEKCIRHHEKQIRHHEKCIRHHEKCIRHFKMASELENKTTEQEHVIFSTKNAFVKRSEIHGYGILF
jgi:hypothetical protein